MTTQVVVPYLTHNWCLMDMLKSFGSSDIPILIVDNSENNDCANQDLIYLPPELNIEVQHYGKNIGVSASWNKGLEKGADQTIILSQWVRFAPAELPWRKDPWGLDHIANGINEHATEYGLEFADQGYHIMSIGRKTVETIGTFDENFVVFGGDDDYQHRRSLAGIRDLMGIWADYKDSGVHSIAFGAHKISGRIDQVKGWDSTDYYISKWGSVPGHFDHPFNDINNGLDFWKK